MAGKKVENVQAVEAKKPAKPIAKPVRLTLEEPDLDRLKRVAKAKGLSAASYTRMVVLGAIKEDEDR